MIHKFIFSVASAFLIWILGVSSFLVSFYLQILDDTELQANLILAIALIPSACLGTYLFYQRKYLKPYMLALIVMACIAILDACITVPVFLIPIGISHSDFFSDPKFYAIAAELFIVVTYFGNHLTKKVTA